MEEVERSAKRNQIPNELSLLVALCQLRHMTFDPIVVATNLPFGSRVERVN